jgi:hypothetical protein
VGGEKGGVGGERKKTFSRMVGRRCGWGEEEAGVGGEGGRSDVQGGTERGGVRRYLVTLELFEQVVSLSFR